LEKAPLREHSRGDVMDKLRDLVAEAPEVNKSS
jgi:hypothetical protein